MDKKIANFLFEAGMLRKTPRSGFQFLGSGEESVAEHTLTVIFVAYALAKMATDVDEERLLKMCLFHDLPEARTGDMNYVNKKYVRVDEKGAVRDLTMELPFGDDIIALIAEYNARTSHEAMLAHDADQIALLLRLKECKDTGNCYSDDWIGFAERRVTTDIGKRLTKAILSVNAADWWFSDKRGDWWVNGKSKE